MWPGCEMKHTARGQHSQGGQVEPLQFRGMEQVMSVFELTKQLPESPCTQLSATGEAPQLLVAQEGVIR